MLELKNIKVVYSDVVLALNEVSMTIKDGDIAVLMGSNGSGKSTTLKSISGVLSTEDGKLNEGQITLDGKRIDRLRPEKIAQRGICHVLQGRSVFQHLTTEENLLMGTYRRKNRKEIAQDLERVYTYFPVLKDLIGRKSGYLSGGEQQMLVIGRAFLSRPRIMLLDEPSLGLAPMLIDTIFSILKQMNEEEKTTLLIAEQHAAIALSIAHHGYVLQNGRVASSGSAEELSQSAQIKGAYLGASHTGSFVSYHDSPAVGHNDDK